MYLKFIATIVLAIGAIASVVLNSDGGESLQKSDLNAVDLTSGKFLVLGKSGFPVGTPLTLRCVRGVVNEQVTSSQKLDQRVIYVTKVNGKTINPMLEFSINFVLPVLPKDGQLLSDANEFECRGFEGVRTLVIPNELFPEGKVPIASPFKFGFYQTLEITSLVKVK